MENELIDIEHIEKFVQECKNKVLPQLRKIMEEEGDRFYIDEMANFLRQNSSAIRSNAFNLNVEFFNQCRHNGLHLGGFYIDEPRRVVLVSQGYGLYGDQLLKKDIYFICLFLMPLLERFNEKLNNHSVLLYDQLTTNQIERVYTLVKRIVYDVRRIYGNVYLYELDTIQSVLYNLAKKHNCDLRTSDQKFADNAKEAVDGCLLFILKLIIGTIIFGGIGMCLTQC